MMRAALDIILSNIQNPPPYEIINENNSGTDMRATGHPGRERLPVSDKKVIHKD